MAKKTPKTSLTTSRTIFFFQLVDSFSEIALSPPELTALYSDLKIISLDKKRAYMQVENNDAARVWIDGITNSSCNMKFGITRRSSLPPMEADGVLEELNLKPEQGLSELIHITAFSNAVFGIEFNFYGPRPSKLAKYIFNKTGRNVKFLNLLSRESEEQLARFGSLTKLHMKVKSEVVDEIKQASETVGGLLEKMSEYNGVHDIEISIGTKARSEDALDSRILKGIKAIYKNFADWSSIKALEIKGNEPITNHELELDLLKEQLLSKQHVVRMSERSRQIESESAYQAIEKAKNELKSVIEKSAGGKL